METVKILTAEGIFEVSLERLCSQSADGILYDLNRDEATTETLMLSKKNGGLPKLRLVNDLAVAKVIRYLKREDREPDWKFLSTADLQNLVERKTNELFRMRQILDKRRGVVEKRQVDVDFTDYLTD